MNGRLRRLAAPLLATALCGWLLVLMAGTALHKQFWLDEGFEALQVCERPAARMLLEGSFGCSPAPLHSILQRVVTRSVEPLGLSMRLTLRALSLAAATLAVLVLLAGLQHRLGLPTALVAFATLAADEGFHHYAEQNRAYITWVLATAVLIVVTAEVHLRGPALRLRTRLAWLLGAALIAALSATPGCGQAAAALGAFWLLQRARGGTPLGRKATLLLAAAAIGVVALDVYYWSGSICRGWGGANELGLDFRGGQAHSTIVANAASPIWPPSSVPGAWLLRGLVLCGALAPLRWWRRRAELGPAERSVVALWLIALTQVLVAVPIAAGLIASRYLFLPRMFIFLLAPRAVLAAIGFWCLVAFAREILADRARVVGGLAAAAAALLTAAALWRADRIGRAWQFPFPPVGEVPCASLLGPELRLLRPIESREDFRLNFLVRLGRAIESCPATPSPVGEPAYLLAIDATNQPDWLRVVREPVPGFDPFVLCGDPIVLRGGRFRWR